MVNKLYLRLMATQCLMLALGGFLFWLTGIALNWPEPLAVLLAFVATMVAAAVVVGVVLQPIDGVLCAIRHLSAGEGVPLPEGRSDDTKAMIAAVASLQERLTKASKPADATPLWGVLNSLSEGILVLDQDLKPVFANTALRTLADVTSQDESPEAYRHIFHARCFVPDQLALIEDEMVKHADRPRTDIIQLERPKQYLKRYNAPLYNERNERIGFLVSFTDITQQVVEDRLRQDFISNASHELRTPVTSVKVLLENLQDGAKDDPEVRDEFIDDAAREIDRMHDLVNDLLDIAALESGRHTLALSSFSIEKVVQEAVSTVSPQAKQRGVAIAPELLGEDLSLEGDSNRIRQVLVNLVTNAVKFTPSGGEVRVKAWREAEQLRVVIADTGIGIPAQDLPHIFDRFFRVTRGRSRLQGGSGLGLTIVKQAIDAHSGTITVESTEGQGTSFFISLPVSQREPGV